MKQLCTFNPVRDIEEAVPELVVDIADVMRTGIVASTGSLAPYTKEDDVHAVGHYLKDKIETVMAAKRLDASMARAAASAKVSTAGQPAAAPAATSSPSPAQPASGE